MDAHIGRSLGAGAYIGHSASTAFIGLALGLARFAPARYKRRAAWALPLIAGGWMVFDHGVFNYAGAHRLPALLRVLYAVDGRGYLSSIVLYALIAVAIVLERRILRRGRERIAGLQLSRQRLRLLKGSFERPLARPLHLLGVGTFLRERRGLIYGRHFYEQGVERDAALGDGLERLERGLQGQKEALELPPDDER
jgi:hypothetical protein